MGDFDELRSELISVYLQESREQLSEMENGLLKLEQHPEDADNINAIFRFAHTIKGGAGVVECSFLEQFTHHVESLLDLLRNNELAVSPELASLLLSCCDHMGKLLGILAEDAMPDESVEANGRLLCEQLVAMSGKDTHPVVNEEEASVESSGGGVVNTDSWHISVRFGENVLRGGMDPLSFIRFLGSQGEIIGIETVSDSIPIADAMDPESCYLGFEIRLQTKASKSEIERVFDFVRDDCELRILPPHSKLNDYIQLIKELPEDTLKLGEMLVRCGALTQAELDDGLHLQKAEVCDNDTPDEVVPHPLGEILVEKKVVHKEVVDAAVAKQSQVVDKKTRDAQMIRVQADKLDQLIDLVGELVIAGASANLIALKSKHSELLEATSVLSRLVESIRDSALQLRMVQIGDTFSRFNRVVRDVSKELGKDIELAISGAETELDKSFVEKIADPLMHLVRNSLDHGIESADVRLARGKSAKGRVSLNAYHDSGSIVIQVSDDGGGLNAEKIRNKAIERELIQASDTLSEAEIINLVFEPGFSTADAVSKLSGRGVGMDVVRKNIQALRGTVDVSSVEGMGTTFTIRLPLTLAIIDGFLVSIGKASYVIPLDAVVECIEQKNLNGERNFLNLRGEALPFIRLRELFEIEGATPVRESIVVVQFGGQRAGIVVDQLVGEFQTVIKPLGRMFANLRGISGSTILGSGEVALILDVAALLAIVMRGEEQGLLAFRQPSLGASLAKIDRS